MKDIQFAGFDFERETREQIGVDAFTTRVSPDDIDDAVVCRIVYNRQTIELTIQAELASGEECAKYSIEVGSAFLLHEALASLERRQILNRLFDILRSASTDEVPGEIDDTRRFALLEGVEA